MKSNQLISFSMVNWKQYLPKGISSEQHGNYLPENTADGLAMSHVKYVFGSAMPDEFYKFFEKKLRNKSEEIEGFKHIKKSLQQTEYIVPLVQDLLSYVSKLTISDETAIFQGEFPTEQEFREDLKNFYQQYYVLELCSS